MTAYADLLARAEADPRVVGVILSGSQARGMTTSRSDHDVFVIVDGGRADFVRSPELDVATFSIGTLADTSVRWQRYAYRDAQVVLDRLDGRIADLVHAQAVPTPEESLAWAREQLDGYVNLVYRAAKSRRDGQHDLARLDEIEAVPWFLETLFALYGRLRPYNKYLRWELETYPLPAPWTADGLIGGLAERAPALFDDMEALARAKGCADVLDGWGDDLSLVRG